MKWKISTQEKKGDFLICAFPLKAGGWAYRIAIIPGEVILLNGGQFGE